MIVRNKNQDISCRFWERFFICISNANLRSPVAQIESYWTCIFRLGQKVWLMLYSLDYSSLEKYFISIGRQGGGVGGSPPGNQKTVHTSDKPLFTVNPPTNNLNNTPPTPTPVIQQNNSTFLPIDHTCILHISTKLTILHWYETINFHKRL